MVPQASNIILDSAYIESRKGQAVIKVVITVYCLSTHVCSIYLWSLQKHHVSKVLGHIAHVCSQERPKVNTTYMWTYGNGQSSQTLSQMI